MNMNMLAKLPLPMLNPSSLQQHRTGTCLNKLPLEQLLLQAKQATLCPLEEVRMYS